MGVADLPPVSKCVRNSPANRANPEGTCLYEQETISRDSCGFVGRKSFSMPNEIDLRDYLDALIRHWKLVLAMPVLAALATALVTIAIKPTYEATATLALAPSTVSISLSNQLPPYYLMVDSPLHLPTAYTPTFYIAILKGADVVSAAQPRAAVTLASDSNDRSLIQIIARGDDPAQVADTANAYAQAGAQRIARLLEPTGENVAAAKKKLDAAQQALDKFLADNKLSDYDPAMPPALPPEKRQAINELSRERDLADSVYLDFAREFAKNVILAQSSLRPTVVLAPVPASALAPRLAQNLLIGAAFGLLIGIVGAFALEYVSSRRRKD